MPAFSDVENIDGDKFEQSSLLTTTLFDMNNPKLNWISLDVPKDSVISKKETKMDFLFYKATYR